MAKLQSEGPVADGRDRRAVSRPHLGGPAEVRVRLLGGFEVWRQDRPISSFESQKVRALFAYLLCHRERTFSRDHLAGLLWPERDPESARHALRQALYNLKTALPGGVPTVLGRDAGLQLNPAAGIWLDVSAFEEAARLGRASNAVDPSHLTTAAQLYRGELLAGFFVKESEGFEDWLLTEQERLREVAIDVLRTLMGTYRGRGEYRFGLSYARRLATLEPLSEEACRDVMRLSLLAGRRSHALSEYEKLRRLLRDELGVEPLKETREVYESVLREPADGVELVADAEPIGPLVPLAGRGQALAALLADWEQVRSGHARVTLVTGEPGSGKTRLVKSFLDAATSQQRVAVVKGRGDELDPPVPYRPIAEALAGVLLDEGGLAEAVLSKLPPPVLADLSLLCPAVRDLRLDIPAAEPLTDASGRRRLFDSVSFFLAALCRAEDGTPDPLIIYLDDLHRGDPDSFALLKHLADRLTGLPVWILGVSLAGEEHHLRGLLSGPAGQRGTEVALARLPPAALHEIAESLVPEVQAAELARFLGAASGGLPIEVAELINFLWDDGLLVPAGPAGWSLSGPLDGLSLPGNGSIDVLILHRIRRLPSSTRRLATLAAVAGPSFDFALLERAGDEHAAVIEVGLELLLKHWLLRQSMPHWESGRRRRDLTLWTQGMRRGRFEFAHRHIRNALYNTIDPARRRALHAQVAGALEVQAAAGGEPVSEALAHHWTAAGDWSKALSHLERAVRNARALQAEAAAGHFYRQAMDLLGRLCEGAGGAEGAAAAWTAARSRFLALGA